MSSRRNTGAAANKSNGGSDKAGSGGLKSKKAGGKKGAGSDTQVTDTKSRGNVDGGIHSDNTNKAYNLVNSSDPSAAAAVSASSSSSSSKELNDDQFFRKLYVDERKLEKMESLEHENDTLKTIAKELRLRLDKHVQSQTQIIQHLKAKVKKRDKRITELLNVEKELLDKSVLMDKKYVEEKEEIEDSFKFRIEEYEGKIQVLEAQYREIKHFETNKSQLEHDLKTLEEQLDEEKLQHNLHVSALERRNVMEKNRLKNEMLRKIRETKLNLLAMTEDQLHTTTKRTIMENEQMTTELQYQSKETERIVRKNNKLMSETRAMKRQIELDEKAKEMMAKRTHFFQKLIKKLNRKLKLMEGEMQTLRTRNMLGQGSSGGMGIGVGIGLGGVAGTGGDAAMNGGLGGSGLALTASSSSMGGFYNTNNSNTITSRGFKQGSSSARLHTTGKFGLSGKSKTNSLTSPSSAHSNSYLKQQYKQLEVKHKNLLKRCKKVLGEKEDKEIELENTRKASYRMLQLQDEAVTFIMACIEDITRNLEDGTLQDVKGPAVRIDTGQPLPGTRPETLNELNNYDKLVVLHMLLNKLDFRNPFTKHPILNLNPLQNTPGNISSGSVHVSSSQEYYQGYIAPHLQQSVDAVDADAQERGMGLGDIEQYNRHASDEQGSSRNEMLQNINHMVERIGESPREFDYYSSSTIKSGNDINDNNQNENETEGSGGDYEDQNDQAINRYDYLARQQLNTPQFGE